MEIKKKKKEWGLEKFRQWFSPERAQDTGPFLQNIVFWARGCWKYLLLTLLTLRDKRYHCLSETATSGWVKKGWLMWWGLQQVMQLLRESTWVVAAALRQLLPFFRGDSPRAAFGRVHPEGSWCLHPITHMFTPYLTWTPNLITADFTPDTQQSST